jgi:exoribonuclease R
MNKINNETNLESKNDMIYFNNQYTDFCSRVTDCTPDSDHRINYIYGLDTSDRLHLDIIPGVLKLSSKNYKSTDTKGYIMKEFEPAFGYLPTFMVKTNKIKDYIDKFVIVRIIHRVINKKRSITGTVEQYIGNVGDVMIEKELCKIMSTCHWSRKYDRLLHGLSFEPSEGPSFESSIRTNDNLNLELEKIGITFDDLTPKRLDLTSNNIYTVSVDPLGSKDIDDAISIEILDQFNVLIGIHIADPSSYVIEGSLIDIEVSKRIESIYLLDQTIHMFPEYLSTNIFSLSNGKINRGFSVILNLRLTEQKVWTIINKIVTKTNVMIDRNMTYDEFQSEYQSNNKMLTMYQIGHDLYRKSIDINHQSIDINEYSSKKMIEIFMVQANLTVGEKMIELMTSYGMTSNEYPSLIRSQKTNDLSLQGDYLNSIINPQDYPKLIEDHHKLKMQSAELRFYNFNSISDAKTDDVNSHAHLGLKLYTHFTSPIRRYSDILVHRIMWNLLNFSTTPTMTFNLKIIGGSNDYSPGNESNRLHQMFMMNHFKKFYKQIYQLEREIKMTHLIIESISPDLTNRILDLEGTILDITYNNNKLEKVRIQCKKIISSTNDPTNDSMDNSIAIRSLFSHIKDSLHTITITDSINEEKIEQLKLFNTVQYKVCFLARDVRKIRSYF